MYTTSLPLVLPPRGLKFTMTWNERKKCYMYKEKYDNFVKLFQLLILTRCFITSDSAIDLKLNVLEFIINLHKTTDRKQINVEIYTSRSYVANN